MFYTISFQKIALALYSTLLVGGALLFSAEQQGQDQNAFMGNFQIQHPLDPLTPEEIQTAVSLIKQRKELSETILFPYVYLVEPSKDTVAKYLPGQPIERLAFAGILDSEKNGVYEAIVDLNNKKIQS